MQILHKMEANETLPVLHMCRLCLNYFEDCIEIRKNDLYQAIWIQIKKHFRIEIDVKDSLPQSVCRSCIQRVQLFDKFCDEVAQNQVLLRLSKSKNQNHPSSLIQLASENGPFANESGTIIITLASSELNTNDIAASAIETNDDRFVDIINEAQILCSETETPTTKPTFLQTINIEQEFDDLASTDIAAELREESENECNDDEDEDADIGENEDAVQKSTVYSSINQYKDFPTKILDGCKLLYKGADLLNMISRFYRLECDQCKDPMDRPLFQSLSDLCKHYADRHEMKGYLVCCKTKLIKPRALALHMAKHLQPSAFTCQECHKIFTCPKILQYHVQNHRPESERPFACSQCTRRFSYSSALVAHNISHQPENERAIHICDECGKMFASAGRLTTHINVSHMLHGPDHVCHICAKKFACRTNLNYHLTTHQPNVRRVQCSICDKWLKNKLCLRKHMVQHSSVRYNCTLCDYSALNRQCLRNHMRVQHSNEKPFICDVCGKSFKLKNTLLSHSVQHTGVRKFICPFCERTFASSGNYYSHRKRMHPQELAAMKLKMEENERLLREQPLTTAKTKRR